MARRLPPVAILCLTFAAFACLAVVSPPAHAEPCPTEPGGLNASLRAPERVAFGRQATVNITYDANVTKGVLEYVDSSGQVVFRHELTPAELPPGYPGLGSASSDFPISFAPGAGPLLVTFSYTTGAGWDTPCNYTREITVRPIKGLDPRPSFNLPFSHRVEGDSQDLLFLNRACETLAPGNLQVVVRYHHRQRVLTLSAFDSCPYNPLWVQSGRTMPGLRFGDYSYGPRIQVLGQRNWKRTFRVDMYWNRRRIMRGWVRVTHERMPAHPVYENEDPLFLYACEHGTLGPEFPIQHDSKGRPYCIKPAYWSSSGRTIKRPPNKRS